MTTDQKLSHINWYVHQVRLSNNRDIKAEYIAQGRGALGAWFADMTLSHEQYGMFVNTFKELAEGL